jgi:hypothetical protein
MDPLSLYYVHQAGGGGKDRLDDVIGPIYASTPFVQRGHGIGSFLGGLFRMVKPILVRGARTLGRETLRTGGKILTDIADKEPSVKVRDIVSKHVSDTTKGLVTKLRGGGGLKRKRASTKTKKKTVSSKRAKVIKRDIFS